MKRLHLFKTFFIQVLEHDSTPKKYIYIIKEPFLTLFIQNCEEMKNDRIGLSKGLDKKKRSQNEIFNSKAQRLAEKEYEAYYDKIRQLSRGL